MQQKLLRVIQEKKYNNSDTVIVFQLNKKMEKHNSLSLIEMDGQNFIKNWTAHEQPIKADFIFLFQQFIIFVIDENYTKLSGCSRDKLTHFIKNLEQQYSITCFDRLSLAFVIQNKIELINLNQITQALNCKILTDNTLYFNNVVHNINNLKHNWIIPLKDSWLLTKQC